jgi:hypothetical protein
VGWKYPVLEEPRVPVVWRKVVRMQNWERCIGSCCGLTIERSPKHLLIYAETLEGENPWEMLALARDECDHLAAYLESKFQMRLGRGEMRGPPHWAVWDPVAEQFTKVNGKIDTVIGHMDRSFGRGEIDFTDPRAAYDYLTMPRRLARVETIVTDLAELMLQPRKRRSEKDEDMRRYL